MMGMRGMSTVKATDLEAEFARLMELYNQKHSARKYCTKEHWVLFWKIFSLIIAILTLVVVLISVVFVAQQDSLQRFCLRADHTKVVGGPGEVGGKLFGPLSFDNNDKRLTFEFRTVGLSDVTAIHLKGPVVTGTEIGPIAAVLCGGPGPLPSCDISTPGQVQFTMVKDIYDGMSPGSEDPDVLINRVRANPSLYYVEVLTTGTPASPGAVRAPLHGFCGTP